MKLRFTPRATEDILKIGIYLSERNPDAGQRVRAEIYEGLQNLLLFPNAGRRQKLDRVRKLLTRRYNYLIYYVADQVADEVIVLAVKHPARGRDFDDA